MANAIRDGMRRNHVTLRSILLGFKSIAGHHRALRRIDIL
jgi:hypothetical protein